MELRRETQIVLIRHGHTAANLNGATAVMSGWTDLPLSAIGRWQVVRLRDRLRSEPPFAAIYASPLRRALATATALVDGGRVIEVPELREIHCGEVDGRPIAFVMSRYAAWWERNERQDDEHFRWPGGESYRELRDRCLRAAAEIAGQHVGQRVAVVTHAGVINQILGAVRGLPPGRWGAYRPENSSITRLEWPERGDPVVVGYDDHTHLALAAVGRVG